MREISVVRDIVELVAMEARKQPFARARVIRVQIGVLRHHRPEAVLFHFATVARGTVADGARLEIEMVAGEGWCGVCHCTAPLTDAATPCPTCGYGPLRVVAGDRFRLAEMEVE